MLLQGKTNNPFLKSVLRQFRIYCQKPPKGFEKYFKPGGAPKNEPPPKGGTKDAKPNLPPPSRPSAGQSTSKPGGTKPDQWSFGVFGGTR